MNTCNVVLGSACILCLVASVVLCCLNNTNWTLFLLVAGWSFMFMDWEGK